MVHAIVKAFFNKSHDILPKNQKMLQDQVPLTTITCKMQNNIDYKFFFLNYTLEIIWMDLDAVPSNSLMATTSEPLRTKEAAIKSIRFGTPQMRISSMSCGVKVGKSTMIPGKLTFFLSPKLAELSHRHFTVPAVMSHSNTVRQMVPSEHRIMFPGFRSCASFW